MTSADNHQADDLTSTDEVAEPPSSPLRRSPGALLMAQRETLELSLQQVADQLQITMHFVRAIESDSYDKLPGEVFVRGYIRAYARLLSLDPDQVLMLYDEFNSHKIARKEEAIKRRERRRKDKNRPWVIFSGIALVAVAVGLWYLNPGPPSDTNADSTSEAGLGASDVPSSSAIPQPFVSDPISVQLQAVTSDTSGLMPVNDSPANAAAATAANSSAAAPESSAAAPESSAAAPESSEAPQVTEETTSAMQPAASGRTVMEYWAGEDELRLGFSADSAVQVEHKGGSEVHEQKHVAGDTLVIRGTAPFSVLLGDARNVSLSFNGRKIDISSNIRVDNSARLSIGM